MSAPAAPPGLADRFAQVIAGLSRVLALRASRDRSTTALLLQLHIRLCRTVQRLRTLLARHQAGTLKPPRRRTRQPAAKRPPQPEPPAGPPPSLPRRFGWLVRLERGTGCYREFLRQLIAEPEMQDLLQAAPQAGRLLRPLCHMLALKPPPGLQLPPRPKPAAAQKVRSRPAPARAAPARRRRKPPAETPGDALLPAWVPRLGRLARG